MRKRKTGLINYKKTMVDGILFDSALEAYMYKQLRDNGIKFKLQKTFNLIKPFTYPSDCYERTGKKKGLFNKKSIRKMDYTPDFVSDDSATPEWVIETKGFALKDFPIRFKLFKNIMAGRKKPPHIFVPKNQADCREVIQILKEKGYGE